MEGALRWTLRAAGSVAIFFGLLTVTLGSDGVLGPSSAAANVDSELRFANAFFAMAGVLGWWASTRIVRAADVIRFLSAAVFVGGIGRLIGILAGERPEWPFVVLMVIELFLPVVMLWLLRGVLRDPRVASR